MEYSLDVVQKQIKRLAKKLLALKYDCLYGIPKNGVIVATMLSKELRIPLTDKLSMNRKTLIVDDVIDTGKTIEKYSKLYDCCALISKKPKSRLSKRIKYVQAYCKATEWIKWFWEDEQKDKEDTILRQIEQIGEDASREGLKETPSRVVRSFEKLYGGYKQSPKDVLKTTFSSRYDEIVLLRDIPLFSTCEHHLLPFTGICHIAYIPGKSGRVVGISKMARLMEVFARRMQIQEQLTVQIGEELVKNLEPKGVAVIIKAAHLCMAARGVEKPGSSMVTSYVYGAFKKDMSARQELLSLIKL